VPTPVRDDLDHLLAASVPLIDVRAPAEFARGAFPASCNLPLLDDAERAQVGTCYRQSGQAAAMALGERLTAGAVRAARIAAWQRFAGAHPDAVLYCWRGGLRSRIGQRWLADAGTTIARVDGGYKALRARALAALDAAGTHRDVIVVGGRTGVGKTAFLRACPDAVDLEALAAHRGSAFGALAARPQPAQASFENAVACALLAHAAAGHRRLLLEDESRRIGRLALPAPVHAAMASADVIVLELPFAARIANVRDEYVVQPLAQLAAARHASARDCLPALAEQLLASLDRISRRLGGDAHADIRLRLQRACATHARDLDARAHDDWIGALLARYYDPMYDYQLAQKRERVRASGDAATLRDWLARRAAGSSPS
jgi:tRNA 2-selenouridine synthase